MKKHRYRVPQEPLPGEIVFSPDDYKQQQKHFKVKDYRLSEEACHDYARIATQVRLTLTGRAASLACDSLDSDALVAGHGLPTQINLKDRYGNRSKSSSAACMLEPRRPDLIP